MTYSSEEFEEFRKSRNFYAESIRKFNLIDESLRIAANVVRPGVIERAAELTEPPFTLAAQVAAIRAALMQDKPDAS
jgi:hypothetical protein